MTPISYDECTACAKRIADTAAICPGCWAQSFVSRDSSGFGTIYTATRVFVSLPDERWKDQIPYDVVLVDLDDGFSLLGRANLGIPIEQAPGTRVRGKLIDGVPTFGEQ